MDKDIFLQALRTLSLQEKQELFEILDRHPQLLSYLEKNFEQKFKAIENVDTNQVKDILEEERKEIDTLLDELRNNEAL